MNDLEYLIRDKDITLLSNFKTPAKAKFYYELNTRHDLDNLQEIYNFVKDNNLTILFIWWWTNMLFAFDTYNWVVVKNNLKWWDYNQETKILDSYSSENISDIASQLFDNWQTLWKRFIWLPWSVWWAVYWNAWCFWLEVESNFLSAEVLNLDTWKIEFLSKSNMSFDYRTSKIKGTYNYFIISAKFDLSNLVEKYSSDVDNIYFREYKQPKGNTCWSFFKNPSKEFSAWKLIEDVWLKWKKFWWAFFSEIHWNFLMSDGTATYNDLLNAIHIAQDKVKNEFNIHLEPEVRIISNN